MRDTETGSAISYNQARLPVQGLGAQPSHLIFGLEFTPIFKIRWNKGGAETMEVANQWLVQLETHTIRESPPLPVLRGPGHRGWTTQRLRIEPNKIYEKGKMLM